MPVGTYTGDKKDQPSGAYTGDKEGRRTYGDKDESFIPKDMGDEDTRNRLFAAIKGSEPHLYSLSHCSSRPPLKPSPTARAARCGRMPGSESTEER